MAVHKILFADEPILRQKSHKIKAIDSSTQALIDDMVETLHTASGVGLAAVQIGVPLRVIVIEIPREDPESETEAKEVKPKLYTLINPEIVRRSAEEEIADEGCLCLPNYVGEVRRAYAVTAKAKDRRGKDVRIKGEGLLARALQHEIDHLEGVLFMDRVEDPNTLHYVQPKPEPATEADL